jgi:hypothetical protein
MDRELIRAQRDLRINFPLKRIILIFTPVSENEEEIMAKKFTIKKNRLRSRAAERRLRLKTNPVVKGFKLSVEQKNVELIRSLEERVKAISAQ